VTVTRLAVVFSVLTVACSGTTTPVVTPGQVVIVGDTTFRTREGGVIDVSVHRTFREHDATGTAALHGMALEAAQRSALVGVATARAWLSIVAALAATDAPATYEAAQRGIDELGTMYRGANGSRHIIDDTGHAILLARMAADRGDHVGAGEALTKVLRDRVEIYLRTFQGTVE